jgi:hypothetical protein
VFFVYSRTAPPFAFVPRGARVHPFLCVFFLSRRRFAFVSSASLGLCGTERSRPKQPRRRRPRVPRCRFSDHFLSQRVATCIACLHPVCAVCSLIVFSRGAPRLSCLVFSRCDVAVRELDSAPLPRFSVCPNDRVFRFFSLSDISSPAGTPSEPLSLSDCSPQLRQPLRRARICSAWRAAPPVLRFSHWFGSSTRNQHRQFFNWLSSSRLVSGFFFVLGLDPRHGGRRAVSPRFLRQAVSRRQALSLFSLSIFRRCHVLLGWVLRALTTPALTRLAEIFLGLCAS